MDTETDRIKALREQERQILELLDQLRDSYVKAAQPYLTRLHSIRAVIDPPRVVVPEETARSLGLIQ